MAGSSLMGRICLCDAVCTGRLHAWQVGGRSVRNIAQSLCSIHMALGLAAQRAKGDAEKDLNAQLCRTNQVEGQETAKTLEHKLSRKAFPEVNSVYQQKQRAL